MPEAIKCYKCEFKSDYINQVSMRPWMVVLSIFQETLTYICIE